MNKYKESVIAEHKNILDKVNSLENFIYGNNGLNSLTGIEYNKTQEGLLKNMIEYANLCMQLMSLRNVLKAIECRLNSVGIFYDDNKYFENVANVVEVAQDESRNDESNQDENN